MVLYDLKNTISNSLTVFCGVKLLETKALFDEVVAEMNEFVIGLERAFHDHAAEYEVW